MLKLTPLGYMNNCGLSLIQDKLLKGFPLLITNTTPPDFQEKWNHIREHDQVGLLVPTVSVGTAVSKLPSFLLAGAE